jgi:DNA replication protein DnaC
VLEQLYTIVNTRYEDGRAMVLTTNLADDALQTQIGARTVSRIHEMCGTPLPLFGDDHRREEGSGIIAMPEPARATPRGAGRWRQDSPAGDDDDAFWEHGAGARTPAYGRPRNAPGDDLD